MAEGLTTALCQYCKNISVIEQSQLSKILSEAKLELTGVTESSGTQKIGKILGVDAIVTVTLDDLRCNRTMVNARLDSSATGEVLTAAAIQIDRTWDDVPHAPLRTPTVTSPKTHYMSALIPIHTGSYGAPPPGRRRVLPYPNSN